MRPAILFYLVNLLKITTRGGRIIRDETRHKITVAMVLNSPGRLIVRVLI